MSSALSSHLTVTSPYHKRRILSVAQDIIFCATNGRVKPPKYLSLPVTVHHLTGSTQLVQLLNRFGHVISVSQLQRLETAIADEQLSRYSQLPSNIVANVPAVFCWDNNNDIVEETHTGAGTTHCTNGIVIQRLSHNVAMPLPKAPSKTSRKRTLRPSPVELDHYSAGRRKGPTPTEVYILRY